MTAHGRLVAGSGICAVALAFACAPSAFAGGGDYLFSGGTRAQKAQVRAALRASSFPWGLVAGPVIINIRRGVGPHAVAGQIWLDAHLLDSGRFSWGVVQHEYAHQVDFGLLTDPMRAELHTLLGGSSWWGGPHADADTERFADAVAWAYWQAPENVMRPEVGSGRGTADASAASSRFRSLLGALLAGWVH